MIRNLLLTWASNVVAIFVASGLLKDVDYSRFYVLAAAGLVFGLVNFLVKPVVKALAPPLVVITLGLALFLVNIVMLYLTDWLVSGFTIGRFGNAVGATVIVWAVNSLLFALFAMEERGRRKRA